MNVGEKFGQRVSNVFFAEASPSFCASVCACVRASMARCRQQQLHKYDACLQHSNTQHTAKYPTGGRKHTIHRGILFFKQAHRQDKIMNAKLYLLRRSSQEKLRFWFPQTKNSETFHRPKNKSHILTSTNAKHLLFCNKKNLIFNK